MSTTDPTKRILTEFGEPEKFFGFTFADLKLLLPTLFLSLMVVGNTPSGFRLIGWGVAAALILGTLVTIYASPDHQSTPSWMRARLGHALQPRVLTLEGKSNISGPTKEFSPDIDDQRHIDESEAVHPLRDKISPPSQTTRTRELSQIDRFHVGHGAGERSDGYVFGAVQVEPANMALATQSDWERAANRLGSIVNSLEFPFQIYSTVRPVDPQQVTAGYRERLEDQSTDLNSELQSLIETYERKFPREFARRGTSIREFYIIVSVSALAVQRDVTSINEDGVLANLERLPYVGGFFTTFRAQRRDLSTAELESKQIAELNHRLATVEEEFAGLEDCSTTRISTPELTALLKDFWDPSDRTDDDPTPSVRTSPVVHRESLIDRENAQFSGGGGSE